jgi:hypothetical protein
MERVIIVFARYVCAVMVACVVSAAFFFGLMSLLFFIGVDGSGAPYASCFVLPIMGFGGVLAGSFCLERASRRFGSMFLLFLGLAYFTHWIYYLKYREGDFMGNPNFWMVQLGVLAVGGVAAVVLVFLRFSTGPVIRKKRLIGEGL